jgi:hypothetical protein
VAAVVQAEQDARCEFDGRGSNAKACPALKVVEEGLQGLVQDLLGGLGRMDVPPARPMAGPGIQFLDVQTLQCVLDIAGDGRPVGVRDDLDGLGFGRFTQVRPGSEQLIEHDGFLRRRQGLAGGLVAQRRALTLPFVVLIVHGRFLVAAASEPARAELWSSGHGSPLPLPGCSRAAGTKEGRPARWLASPHLATPAGSYA